MTIDHSLRAAAQSAMTDPGVSAVKKVLLNTASKNFTLSDHTNPSTDALNVSVDRFCACRDSPSVPVECSTTCTGLTPTFIYYRLSGVKTYSGMIMPSMALNSSVQVQIR